MQRMQLMPFNLQAMRLILLLTVVIFMLIRRPPQAIMPLSIKMTMPEWQVTSVLLTAPLTEDTTDYTFAEEQAHLHMLPML